MGGYEGIWRDIEGYEGYEGIWRDMKGYGGDMSIKRASRAADGCTADS
jgi:hypothetical protein